MKSRAVSVGFGFAAGMLIAGVDNVASHGEVSPTVIVGLLIIATATEGYVWGWRGALPALVTWLCVPLVHVIKNVLDLPDTLQPNTYTSIMMLARVHVPRLSNWRWMCECSSGRSVERPSHSW